MSTASEDRKHQHDAADRGGEDMALQRMHSVVGGLASVDANLFEDENVRRHVRYLAAMVPARVQDGPVGTMIADVVGNPRLTLAVVDKLLTGDEARLRGAADLLRAGVAKQEVASTFGIEADTASKLGSFLGAVDAHAEYAGTGRDRPAREGGA